MEGGGVSASFLDVFLEIWRGKGRGRKRGRAKICHDNCSTNLKNLFLFLFPILSTPWKHRVFQSFLSEKESGNPFKAVIE